MYVKDAVFSGVLTGGSARRLSVLAVGKSTPGDANLGDGECVNAFRLVRLHIRTSAQTIPPVGIEPTTLTPVT